MAGAQLTPLLPNQCGVADKLMQSHAIPRTGHALFAKLHTDFHTKLLY